MAQPSSIINHASPAASFPLAVFLLAIPAATNSLHLPSPKYLCGLPSDSDKYSPSCYHDYFSALLLSPANRTTLNVEIATQSQASRLFLIECSINKTYDNGWF
ncbi:hypothetical protein [Erwinia typographi]|uniref:hypothetical protein n=1 Tax=Erwinia typographi TaxID=371042 RepID=UPI000AFA40C1|nr:hypothetical protein [Erwinia typographi]